MNAFQTSEDTARLTTTEEVFRQLRSDIVSLRLDPGSKVSEVEVAKAFNVSRQPVREAFMRLGKLNLLLIRPQKATRVRKISHQDIRNTRFIRASVEVEVVRAACAERNDQALAMIRENLKQQRLAFETGDPIMMRDLDYEFHRLICVAADRLPAFQVIAENKTHTDRVCTLELADISGMAEVLEGHTAIYDAIVLGDEELAVSRSRSHLMHLDGTLSRACKNYPEFFED
jgi:DNA-binding GntR family transcriptional regulator